MKSESAVYVFDLDGVITDPSNTTINEQAIGHIHQLLEQGRYVAVNSGRSFEWVEQYLLAAIERLGGADRFDHLFIVCEKGGESIRWQDGAFVPQPSTFALSP